MANNTSPLGDFSSLRFPDNVGTDEVPAFIRFVPQKVEYGGTKGLNPVDRPGLLSGSSASKFQLQNSSIDGLSGAINQVKTQIGGAIDSFANGAKQAIGAINNTFQSASFSEFTNNLGKIVSGKINFGLSLVFR